MTALWQNMDEQEAPNDVAYFMGLNGGDSGAKMRSYSDADA